MRKLIPIVALWFFLLAVKSYGQAMPFVKAQFFTDSGVRAAGYKMCTYAAGTTTPLSTYSTAADAIAGTNPIAPPRTLDSAGRIDQFLGTSSYKIILYAPTPTNVNTCNGVGVGAAVWTEDNIAFLPLIINITTLTAKTINNVQYCNAYAGATADVKLAACFAALPTSGGVADANGIQGAQTLAADPFNGVTKSIQLLISGATFSHNVPVTVPSNFQMVMGEGALFSVGPANTLTIKGSMSGSALSRHFAGTGTVQITSDRIPAVYPQWWGFASSNTGTANSTALTAMMASVLDGIEVDIPRGTYSFASTWTRNKTLNVVCAGNALFAGDGVNLRYTGTGGIAMNLTASASQTHNCGLYDYGTGATGVQFASTQHLWEGGTVQQFDDNFADDGSSRNLITIRNCFIAYGSDSGWYMQRGNDLVSDNNTFYSNLYGIIAGGFVGSSGINGLYIVNGNDFETFGTSGNGAKGITLVAVAGLVINGNYFETNADGTPTAGTEGQLSISVDGDVYGCSITGNRFQGNVISATGVSATNYAITAGANFNWMQGCVASGNTYTNFKTFAVNVNGHNNTWGPDRLTGTTPGLMSTSPSAYGLMTIDATTNRGIVFGVGLVVGAPTGGHKGDGTINVAGGIYLNNSAYTNPDYVFDHYFSTINSQNQNEMARSYPGLIPLDQLEQFTKSNRELPRVGNPENGEIFRRSDVLLEKLEEAYLYIFELNARIKALEMK